MINRTKVAWDLVKMFVLEPTHFISINVQKRSNHNITWHKANLHMGVNT
jgi:hypothetical protein